MSGGDLGSKCGPVVSLLHARPKQSSGRNSDPNQAEGSARLAGRQRAIRPRFLVSQTPRLSTYEYEYSIYCSDGCSRLTVTANSAGNSLAAFICTSRRFIRSPLRLRTPKPRAEQPRFQPPEQSRQRWKCATDGNTFTLSPK
jgi:hypothetical protein